MKFINALLLIGMFFGLATPALATFSLTKYNAYGFIIDSDIRKRAIQRMTLHITAANTDTDLDIGDDSGTFWTAAEADTTYGDLGSKALDTIQAIDDVVKALNDINGLEDYANNGNAACPTIDGYCDTAATDETGAYYDLVTCTGLLTTDTIRSVYMKTTNANKTALTGAYLSASGTMRLEFTSSPGATGVARVSYDRAAASKCYYISSISSYRPNIVFISGQAPTSMVITLEWELTDEKYIIRADYGS